MESQANITALLKGWQQGNEAAATELFELTYQRLRELARGQLHGDRQRFVIQPTELVNECALRLFGTHQIEWQNRAHFFAMATTTMRRILVDQARRKQSSKRAGVELTLVTRNLGDTSDTLDVQDLDEALTRLSALSEEKARIVELKFFGGLTNKEIAEVLSLSESSIKRSWRAARAWLQTELSG